MGSHFEVRSGVLVPTLSFPYHAYATFVCQKCGVAAICQLLMAVTGLQKVGSIVKATCGECGITWFGCSACAYAKEENTRHVISAGNKARHLLKRKHLLAEEFCRKATEPETQEVTFFKKRGVDRTRQLDEYLRAYLGPETAGYDYLAYEIKHGLSGKTKVVVQGAFPGCFSTDNLVDAEEAERDFQACCNYYSLPKQAREKFREQTWFAYQQGRRHQREDDDPNSDGWSAKRILPPCDNVEMNNRYFTSVSCVTKNLPMPAIDRSISLHACVSPLDCIKDLLANPNKTEGIPLGGAPTAGSLGMPYSWITESPRAEEIRKVILSSMEQYDGGIKHTVLCLPLLTWQDDFDANNSTKKNRGSVHIITLTIAPHRDDRNNARQTYPISMGRSRDNNHNGVALAVSQQLKLLREEPQIMFSRNHGEPVAVFGVVYAILTDQPERRKALMTQTGNSNNHARFLFSTRAKDLVPVLRTCHSCRDELRKGILPRGCSECVCWDVEVGLADGAPAALVEKLKLDLVKNYPRTHLENSEGIQYLTADSKILPFRMTSERLKASFSLAYENLFKENWTNDQAEEFLKRECIDDEITKSLCAAAANARVLEQIRTKTSKESPFAQGLILKDYNEKPSEYQKPATPPSWDVQGGLAIFIDVLMHLLFLGIVKSVLGTLRMWMCRQGKWTEFHRHTEEFNRLLKNLKLDWLRVEEYRDTGAFGGWVSENYNSFSRVMKWFFQKIPDLTTNMSSVAVPTGLPKSNWLKAHKVHWLRSRGLKSSGTVPELNARIKKQLNLPNGPPDELETVAGEYVPEQVERMMVALGEMLESIMVEEVVPGITVERMELKIKLFLTEFDLLDQQVKTAGTKPKIISSFNFICLLNLPMATARFGPLRNLWEGGFKGEGFIGSCKKFLRYGQRAGFEFNALKNSLTERALHRAAEGLVVRKSGKVFPGMSWCQALAAYTGDFKTYTDNVEVMTLLAEGGAISVVVCSSNGTTLALAMVKDEKGVLLRPSETFISKMGVRYACWQAVLTLTTSQLGIHLEMPHCAHISFGVLLPLFDERGPSAKHTFVRSMRYGV